VAEAAIYLATLALFSFITVASALIKGQTLLLACIPPVFVAIITGFVMAIYAADSFGPIPTVAALALGLPSGWLLARRLPPGRLLLVIYLVWGLSMIGALVGFSFPDAA
jgi:hypothetical protein